MKKQPNALHPGDSAEAVDIVRRSLMLRAGVGLGAIAAADLLGMQQAGATTGAPALSNVNTGVLGSGHFPARAKRVIYMHMLGAYSSVDTFDYKPTLIKMSGQEMPASALGNQKLSTMSGGQSSFTVAGPLASFKQRGQSGAWVSDLMPYTAGVVDELCFIRSLYSDQLNHDPGSKLLQTGFQLSGRPSIGAWISYALGSDNSDLPSFVIMNAGLPVGVPQDAALWGAGFLPSEYQGVKFMSGADPVLYLNNLGGVTAQGRRRMLDALGSLARLDYQTQHDAEILSRVRQYEMSYRMQRSVPAITDIKDEPQHVLDMYGPDVTKPGTFAHNCLIARRMSERGVKFITLYGMGWDHHFFIKNQMPGQCRMVDQPAAALVMDLKQRGMLDDTLVLFGSEFGRTPFAQGTLNDPGWGRDHHGGNFTWWMAGAGTRAGYSHGETDDFNFKVVKDKVDTWDLNATILHLLGIDHEKLTYRYQGRDFRLTDVHGQLVKQVIA